MKLLFPAFFLFIINLSSCTNKEGAADISFKELTGQQQLFLDTIVLDESKNLIPRIHGAKISNDSILSYLDMNGTSLTLYSTKGNFLCRFDNDYVKGTRLPDISIGAHTIQGDNLYLLYWHTNQIYHLKLSGEYVGKYQLNFPETGGMGAGNGEILFERDTAKGKFILYSEYGAWKELREKYERSKIISVFDEEGQLAGSFGSFPEEYTEGKLVYSKQLNMVYEEGFVYVLHSLGEPKILQYNLQGELIEEFPFNPRFFDGEIRFHKGDPFSADPHDNFKNLAIRKKNGEREFIITYGYFEKNERSERGHQSYRTNLVKLNVDSKTMAEYELAGAESIHATHLLIPTLASDTFHFVVKPEAMEQTLLLRAIIQ